MNNHLFGDKTPTEVEKFEKDSNGIILFNGVGENALSVQKSRETFLLFADKINQSDKGDHPNLFIFSETDVCKMFNFLGEIIKKHPEKYILEKEIFAIKRNNNFSQN